MARPKKNQNEAQAKERLELAFWELLKLQPYPKITVRALAAQAQVNHNTFYYYYDNMDEMALALVRQSIPEEFLLVLSRMMAGESFNAGMVENVPKLDECFKRLQLILSNGSPHLTEELKNRLVPSLFSQLGADTSKISESDWMKISFVFGGVTALMSNKRINTLAEYLAVVQDGIVDSCSRLWLQVVQNCSYDKG